MRERDAALASFLEPLAFAPGTASSRSSRAARLRPSAWLVMLCFVTCELDTIAGCLDVDIASGCTDAARWLNTGWSSLDACAARARAPKEADSSGMRGGRATAVILSGGRSLRSLAARLGFEARDWAAWVVSVVSEGSPSTSCKVICVLAAVALRFGFERIGASVRWG